MSESGGHTPPLEAQDVIRRLCALQAAVCCHLGGSDRADCFCGESGFWGADQYGGTFEGGYRNSGECLEFIEKATRERMGSDDAAPQMLAALREARDLALDRQRELQARGNPNGIAEHETDCCLATIDAAIAAATGVQ